MRNVTDADRHCYDQNVMCMRSGLVIKTAPIFRPSPSSRPQPECQIRTPRDLASISAVTGSRPQQSQPLSPSSNPSAPEAGGADFGEVTAGPSTASGGGMAKAGAGRSSGVTRPRCLDFLSIVTRFQLARRARAVQLGTDTVHDEDWMHNALELDFIPHNGSRLLYTVSIIGVFRVNPQPCSSLPNAYIIKLVHSGLHVI